MKKSSVINRFFVWLADCFRIRQSVCYMYLAVCFPGSDKRYTYLSNDSSVRIGDRVRVPVGEYGHTTTAEVVGIFIGTSEEAPYPFYKTKTIIGKD